MHQRTRKLMTMHKALHPCDGPYVSRKEGGRRLASIKDSVDASIRLEDYIEKHEGRLITTTRNNTDNMRTNRKEMTRKQKWKKNYSMDVLTSNISYKKTWTRLRKENLKRGTESLIAALTNTIRTNHIKAKIDKMQQNSRCRLCRDRDKMINHIIRKCSKLAQKEYKTRHDWVDKVIHWELCKKFKFDHTKKWYMYNTKSVLKNEMHKLLWDFEIQTYHLISSRRPDFIIINKKREVQSCGLCWPLSKIRRKRKEG